MSKSSSATPDLHQRNLGVAPAQETFSRLSGPPPKRLLAPSPIDLRGIQEIGPCTRQSGFRKILASINIFARNSGVGNGCANFMGAWKNSFLSAGKPPCP